MSSSEDSLMISIRGWKVGWILEITWLREASTSSSDHFKNFVRPYCNVAPVWSVEALVFDTLMSRSTAHPN